MVLSRRSGFAGLLLLLWAAAARGQTPEALEFFEKKIRPLLAEHCQKCHGPEKQKAHLRLDSRAAILRGGDNGPALVPGKVAESGKVSVTDVPFPGVL